MILPAGSDGEVICQASGLDTMGAHKLHPWVEEVRHDRHTEWASLRNAALFPMGLAKPFSNGIVELHLFVKIHVGLQDSQGKAPSFQQVVDELPEDLVEALPDVSASTRNVKATELRQFEVE
jgi:hypothetical protein